MSLLDHPNLDQAIIWYSSLLKTSPHTRISDINAEQQDDQSTYVDNGQVAMWVNWSIPQFEDVAIIPSPSEISSQDIAVVGGYISAQAKHSEACWKWLQFLVNSKEIAKGAFPARISTARSQEFLKNNPPGTSLVYEAMIDASPKIKQIQQLKLPLPALKWFLQAIDDILQGAPVDKELDNARTKTSQYLDCIRSGDERDQCTGLVEVK